MLEHGFTMMHEGDKCEIQCDKTQHSTATGRTLFPIPGSTVESNESQLEIEYASRWVKADVHHSPDSRRPVVEGEGHGPAALEAMTPV